MSDYDLIVIGGGINGCGIARDAAGRGLRVVLCEQSDLGGATSWASSKMIHGGLRYLEHGEFRLVREALSEREILLRTASHLVRPLRLVLPHVEGMRPRWMIRLGLWFYDHLSGRRRLPLSKAVSLTPDLGLDARYSRGFEYSDAQVDDARLVIANALDAARMGAQILVRTRVTAVTAQAGAWQVQIEPTDGDGDVLRAPVLVNAAGPWAHRMLTRIGADASGGRLRLVRGSHIVIARKPSSRGLLLQNQDGRVVFVLPLEGAFTLIGTTDVEVDDPTDVTMSGAEREYLLAAVNRYLARPIVRDEIVWSYAGLRALVDDSAERPAAITRDYLLQLDRIGGAPCLSVLGGKITTYRRLAEHALGRLAPYLTIRKGEWTASACLPGGDLEGGAAALLARLQSQRPDLPPDILAAMAARHGSLTSQMLGDARTPQDLGRDFGAGLTQREVDYFIRSEWARSGEDVLWRRTKCGLRMTGAQRSAVEEYVTTRSANLPQAPLQVLARG